MLYIVATPIGNLSDITYRAIEVLKKVDYILCEDTRQTAKILAYYDFENKLIPFHLFNESKVETTIINDLQNFRKIALVSDAGMPSVSDPGANLIRACHRHQLAVTVVPGASAILSALCLTGLSDHRFQFVGFLPRKEGALETLLHEIQSYQGVTICFESPRRLIKSLATMQRVLPMNLIYITRELTKKFEELIIGKADKLLEKFIAKPPKGELVLIIPSAKLTPNLTEAKELFSILTQNLPLTKRDAAILTAKIFNIPKKFFYKND